MKANLLLIGASVMIVLASCNSTKQATSGTSDDIYVTKTESTPPPPEVQQGSNGYSDQGEQLNTAPDNSTSEQYKDANGTTYVTNNNYNGAYNDYGSDAGWYTTQMNHFYSPYVGFGYYSPYYMGFNYYDPWYYSPGLSISFSFGFGGYYGYNPWYSPYSYYPYYGYGYNPYWYNPYGYNPYYPGYGCGNDYGYGYGGYNNSYYGYHGSSASNTAGADGGRHYKMSDGLDGDSHQLSGSNRGQISQGGLLQPIGTQNGRGDVKPIDISGKGNISNTNPSIDKTPVIKDIKSAPDRNNSNTIDRNITAPDRNVPAPVRDNAPQRNNTQPKQNNGQIPRHASFSQALNNQSQQQVRNSNYQPQYSGQNTNDVVMNNQRIQQQQQTHSSQQSPVNVQRPVKQDEKKLYAENRDNSSKSSHNSQKQVQSNQKQQYSPSSQQRSNSGSQGSSQSTGRSSGSGGHTSGGGNHNPR